MGGLFQLSCFLGFDLRFGTSVTLCLSLVVSIVVFWVSILQYDYHARLVNPKGPPLWSRYLDGMLQMLVTFWLPFYVGLRGTYLKKPPLLMVAILNIFILTGSFLHYRFFRDAFHFQFNLTINILFEAIVLLILWFFGLVWYSHFLELTESNQTRSEPSPVMGSSFKLNSCLGFDLYNSTALTLYFSVIIPILVFLIHLFFEGTHHAIEESRLFFWSLLPTVVFYSVPFAVGLWMQQKKPQFLMVSILHVFVLTGFLLPVFYQQMSLRRFFSVDFLMFPVVELLVLWYFGLVWYNYYLETQVNANCGSVPQNSA